MMGIGRTTADPSRTHRRTIRILSARYVCALFVLMLGPASDIQLGTCLSVTQPKLALCTTRIYLAKVPRVALYGGICHFFSAGRVHRPIDQQKSGFGLRRSISDRHPATNLGFERDVTNNETVRAAGKTSIGDERDIFPEPAPTMAEVVVNISGIPGRPLGPS
jgi:hypothetical protein